ncbi:MAG TPA: hypothetical protein VFD92_10500 [Candidatus Binatia bacterium]|nr:hypothetical protein [Candidatus Binatia bacterium]
MAVALASGAATPASAAAEDAGSVTVPLTLDLALLRELLRTQVYTDAGGTARVWDDGSGCNELVLSDPDVGVQDGRLRIETRGQASAAWAQIGFCLFPLHWDGFVEVLEEPSLAPGAPVVRFRVVDSNVYGRNRSKGFATGVLWDWVKQYAQPRFAELHLDLAAPLRELAAVVPLFLASDDAQRARRVLRSVSLTGVGVTETGLRIDLEFDVEGAPAAVTPVPPGAPTPEPEPPLGEAEIAAFAAALQQLDGFLTFVVKAAGAETPVAAIRAELLDVLLEERYDLLDALASPRRDARDPARKLFLATWSRLAPVVRRFADTLPAPTALQYLSFLSAGDALAALDRAGPAAGIEISADGLRRLARLAAPQAAGDPLATPPGVDPELRALFGFGSDLPAPEANPDVAADEGADLEGEGGPTGTPAPEPGPEASPSPLGSAPTPDAGTPPASSPGQEPTESTGPTEARQLRGARRIARGLSALGLLGVPEASAALLPVSITDEVVRQLNRWAPSRADVDRYLPLVHGLLTTVVDERLRGDGLAARFHALYRRLVPATAWQESCWRQFVERSGKLVPLRSKVGSIGMMQVNQTVWRGFYDLSGLRGDIRYNARAGSEILSRYLKEYVSDDAQAKTSDADLASWTYAVYNGGPAQLRRFQKGKMSPRERAVDAAFRDKLAKVATGDPLVVAECFRG